MKHTYEYNYDDIDACIRHANQLRSEALGQWLRTGMSACKRLVVRMLKRKDDVRCTITPPRSHGLAC